VGLASFDTHITTITATTIIISTRKNIFATVSESIGGDIMDVIVMDSNTQYLEFLFYFSILGTLLGRKYL
jgi:hypothetical protein